MNQGRGALVWMAGPTSAPCAPDPSRLCGTWTGSGTVARPARAARSVRGRRPRCRMGATWAPVVGDCVLRGSWWGCLSASAHACCVLISRPPDWLLRVVGRPRHHPEALCALSTSCDAWAHSGPEQPLEARTYASAGSVTVPQLRECSVRVRSL